MTDPSTNGDRAGVHAADGQMDAHETAEARVLDPEEYTQKRRIKDVLDARRHVNNVRLEAEDRMYDPGRNGLTGRQARVLYRAAVENYISEARPLMVRKYPDEGEHYWREQDLGTMVIDPPEHFVEPVEPSVSDNIGRLRDPATPQQISFVGLRSLIEAPRTITVNFEADLVNYNGLEETRTETKTVAVGWSILDGARWSVNRFLADIGMDVDADDRLDEDSVAPDY